MNTTARLVGGVGTNDSDYPVTANSASASGYKQAWMCPFYRVWKSVLLRCYSTNYHNRRPGYSGCSTVPEWHTFSVFRAWMITQPWEGNHIDKDLLFPRNKVYGPDTCVFVSARVNTFVLDRAAQRGEWPIGVYQKKGSAAFRALCNNPSIGRQEYLGRFDTPEEAHEAWRARKHELACQYADQQTDARVANALRAKYARM